MSDDEMINTGFISFCAACFLRKGGNPETNPILSPLIAPDFLVGKLPRTHMLVCEIDGLRDQGIAMALRMKKANCSVQLHNYGDFIHGFCNFDNGSLGVKEFSRATVNIIAHMRQMLELPPH